jgi:hypothetical protein
MRVHERALIGFDSLGSLNLSHRVRNQMTSKAKPVNKSKADAAKTNNKPRLSAEQRKIRSQQVVMSVLGLMLVVAMVAALFAR